MMEEERLMAAMVMLGRPLEVDSLSLRKYKTEPIRMKFQCRFPERIRGTVQLVVNGEGFSLDVQAEMGARGGAGGAGNPPRPPPGDDSPDDEDYDDLSPDEEEWQRLGKKDADKVLEKSKEAGKEKQAPTTKDKGVRRDGGSHSAPVSSRVGLAPSFDEYGSNLGGSKPVSFLMDSLCSPGGAGGEVSMDDSQLTELPMGTPEPISTLVAVEPGLEALEGAGGDGDGVGQCVLNLQVEARAASKQAQAPRSKAVYSRAKVAGGPARKSKRLKGTASIPSMEKAKKLAAERNLDAGQFSFTTLSSRSDDALASVLEDSCIVFNPARGSPGMILDLIRAKEEAQAAIAEATFRKEREVAAKAAREAAEAAQQPAAGVDPPVGVVQPQGAGVLSVPQISPREAGIAVLLIVEGSRPIPEGGCELDDRSAPEPCQSPTGVSLGGTAVLLPKSQLVGRDGGPVFPVSMCTRSMSQRKGASRPLLSVRKGQTKRRGSK
jgi:hypothetical protein